MLQNRKLSNDELNRPDKETYQSQQKLPLVIVLDNVRSLNNVGSVFRSSDAFAIEEVILCGITAQPPHREINKTALGATESVNWRHIESTTAAIKKLKSDGWDIFSVEQAEGSISLKDFQPKANQKIALIFGHEVKGVSQAAINLSDNVIEIPQQGTKHSLNIAVSTGLVVWDISCKIRDLQ